MSDISNPVKWRIDRRLREAVGALCLTVGTTASLNWWETRPLAVLSLGSCLLLVVTSIRMFWTLLRVPKLVQLHEEGRRASALRIAEHAEKMEALQRERAEQAKQREEVRAAEFLAVENLDRGEHLTLKTTVGDIRATRCYDGSLRLWWPDFGPVISRARTVVQGRAVWARDELGGWFVSRYNERAILLDLAKI